MRNEELTFTIKEVAKLIGITQATIRNWEKNGLITPQRDLNNYRVFNFKDIDILKRIKEYSIDQHLNNAAIKKLLVNDLKIYSPVFKPQTNVENTVTKKALGDAWRKTREQQNLTLEQVSKSTGISTSYLSQIENGNANISYEILEKLSEFYNESIIHFFNYEDVNIPLVRKKEREPIDVGDVGYNGVYIESLLKVSNASIRPAALTVMPDSGQKLDHSHKGEEFIYVLQGEITVRLNEETEYNIHEGDSLYFDSSVKHSWYNNSNKITILLWVHSLAKY